MVLLYAEIGGNVEFNLEAIRYRSDGVVSVIVSSIEGHKTTILGVLIMPIREWEFLSKLIKCNTIKIIEQ